MRTPPSLNSSDDSSARLHPPRPSGQHPAARRRASGPLPALPPVPAAYDPQAEMGDGAMRYSRRSAYGVKTVFVAPRDSSETTRRIRRQHEAAKLRTDATGMITAASRASAARTSDDSRTTLRSVRVHEHGQTARRVRREHMPAIDYSARVRRPWFAIVAGVIAAALLALAIIAVSHFGWL